MKVRTRFQPTQEIEVDEQEAAALKHQGLLWSGTDKELAALHTEAERGPAPEPTKTSAAPTGTASDKKEGA